MVLEKNISEELISLNLPNPDCLTLYNELKQEYGNDFDSYNLLEKSESDCKELRSNIEKILKDEFNRRLNSNYSASHLKNSVLKKRKGGFYKFRRLKR